jgi:hypothetical protein
MEIIDIKNNNFYHQKIVKSMTFSLVTIFIRLYLFSFQLNNENTKKINFHIKIETIKNMGTLEKEEMVRGRKKNPYQINW